MLAYWRESVVILAYVALVIAIGARFVRQEQSSEDFFLAGRSLGWFPIGMSLTATLVTPLFLVEIADEAFVGGAQFLWWLVGLGLAIPFVAWFVLPRYLGLGLSSVYELLEIRFGPTVRLTCSLLFVIWRLVWAGAIINSTGHLLGLAMGEGFPEWPAILMIGMVTTLYTYLGGMKAVVWTDVLQLIAVFVGMMVLLVFAWGDTVASQVPNLTSSSRLAFSAPGSWSEVALAGQYMLQTALALLSLYATDQITAQRLLAARSLSAARWGLCLHAGLLVLLVVGLGLIGVLIQSGGPDDSLLTATPAAGFAPLGDHLTSDDSRQRLLPEFVAQQVPGVFAALAFVALLGAAMSTFDSTLNSLSAVFVFDLHRRFGWGRRWLARRLGKDANRLTEEDELSLAKPLTCCCGVAVTFLSLVMLNSSTMLYGIVNLLNGVAAPMLGVFILAAFPRRCSARAALVALAVGATATTFLTLIDEQLLASPADFLTPQLVHSSFLVGLTATVLTGTALSFVSAPASANSLDRKSQVF